MPDVTMPAPVAFAGAALCVLGGYLIGAVTGPDAAEESTAEVSSYDPGSDRLCLTGEVVEAESRTGDGELCGTWRHRSGATEPETGDEFRFVTMSSDDGGDQSVTYIYGDVVE